MITGRNLGLLGLVTVAALAVAFWLSGLRSPGHLADEQDLLFPQLAQEADAINRVTLTAAGGEIIATLEKHEDRWTVAEKDGYDADDSAVRKLMIQLTDAEVLEPKTSDPDLYARLGVEDVSVEDAAGMLVTLEGGSESWSLIVGNTAPRASGTFVRKPTQDLSLLVGGDIAPSKTPGLWLDKAILDVTAQRVHRVLIRHADGETLEVIKGVRGQTDFVVPDVPEGRELQSPAAANSIGGTLSGMRLEDVRAGDAVPTEVTVTEFQTFDGLVITARSWEEDELAMATFDVAFDEDLAQRFHAIPVEEQTEDDSSAEVGDDSQVTSDPGDGDDAVGDDSQVPSEPEDGVDKQDIVEPEPEDPFADYRAEADLLQARVTGWLYEIPPYKYSNLNKRMDALLKALPEEADSPGS